MKIIFLLSLLCFLFISCDYAPDMPEKGIPMINYNTGLNFPTNSILVHYVEEDKIDPEWAVKIIVPNISTNSIIESIRTKHLTKRLLRNDPRPENGDWFTSDTSFLSERLGWWWGRKNNTIFEQYYFEYLPRGGRMLIYIILSDEENDFTSVYINFMVPD